MRVLVTGAAGFLGRALCAQLEHEGHEVIAAGHDAAFPVDFRLLDLVADLFAETAPDSVVHLAGTSGPEAEDRGPVDVQTENIVHPLLNVLEIAGSRRVLHVSTAAVYGVGSTEESGPLRPTGLYGASRASAEALALRRAAKFGQDLLVARPFFLLGPDLPPNGGGGRWLVDHAAGRQPRVAGLARERDVLDVRDAARGLYRLLADGSSGFAYNLSSGRTATLGGLVGLLCPGAAPIDVGLEANREPACLAGESKRLRELGWEPRIPFEETLASTSLRASAPRRTPR